MRGERLIPPCRRMTSRRSGARELVFAVVYDGFLRETRERGSCLSHVRLCCIDSYNLDSVGQ